MAVERRKSSGFWYARFRVAGKRVCVPLESRVDGVPGEARYMESLAAAKAEERRLRGAGVRGDAAYHLKVSKALAPGADLETIGRRIRLDRMAGLWIGKPRGRPISKGWESVIRAYGRKFAERLAVAGVETMDKVDPAAAAAYMESLRKSGLTGATFNNILALFKGIFSEFGADAGVAKNPFAKVRRMPVATAHRIPLSRAEIDLLLAACGANIAGAVATAICTGLRRGDACRLEWRCVDLAGGYLRDIHVSKTGARVDVPILPMLLRVLEEAEGKAEERGGKGAGRFVWPEAAELARRSPTMLNYHLLAAMKTAGIEHLAQREGAGKRRANVRGWHSFKTTFITEALNGGMPFEMLRKIVGNSTLEVVRRNYYQPDKAKMAEEMGRALGTFGA